MSDEESNHVPLNQFNASELEELASKQYVPEPYKPAITSETPDRMDNGMTFWESLPKELERVAKQATQSTGSVDNTSLQNVQDLESSAQIEAMSTTGEPLASNDETAASESSTAPDMDRFASVPGRDPKSDALLTLDIEEYTSETLDSRISAERLVLPFRYLAKSSICRIAESEAHKIVGLNKEAFRPQSEADRGEAIHQHTYVNFKGEDVRNMYANDSAHNRCRMTFVRDFFFTQELEFAKQHQLCVILPTVMELRRFTLRQEHVNTDLYAACDRRICTSFTSVNPRSDKVESLRNDRDRGIAERATFGSQADIVHDTTSTQPPTQALGRDLFSRVVDRLMSSAGALPHEAFSPDAIGLTFNSVVGQRENLTRPAYGNLLLVIRLVNHLQSSDLSDVKVPTSMVIKMDKPKQKVSKMVVRTIKEGLGREALRQGSDWNLSLLFSDGNKELWDLDLWAMPNKLEGNQLYWVGKQSVLGFIENDTITDGAVEMYLEAHLVPVRKRKAATSTGP